MMPDGKRSIGGPLDGSQIVRQTDKLMDGAGDSRLLRLLNAQRIVDAMFDASPAPISRAEVARATGLSKPTVSALVGELEEAGVLRPVRADRSGAVGRPATPYEVVPDSGFALAVDIGGTKIVVGIADLVGEVRIEREVETAPDADGAIEQVISVVRALQRELGCQVSSACVGVPGVYRRASDAVDRALNLPGFAGIEVASRLGGALRVDVQVDNDVNLAAVGEAAASAEVVDTADFVAISVGSGIGAGLVLDSELYRGGSDAAGEIGSLVVSNEIGARSVLTLEDVASASGIERGFRAAVEAGDKTLLGEAPSVREILDAASIGDAAACRALDAAGAAMALAVSHLALLVNPDKVIFGGGVGANPIFVGAVDRALAAFTSEPVRIVRSTLGRRAAFVGATIVAVEALQGSLVSQRLRQ